MSLAKRVEELERKQGGGEFLLLVIQWVGCNPEKLGPERVIERSPIGYRTSDRQWLAAPGESLESVKARIEADARAEGLMVLGVRECYEEEQTA